MTAVLIGFGMKGWSTFTVIEPARQGPLLKNRLVEDAATHGQLLDNERLIDSETSVEYFLTLLRGYLVSFLQSSPSKVTVSL